jgi:hypothetical protein
MQQALLCLFFYSFHFFCLVFYLRIFFHFHFFMQKLFSPMRIKQQSRSSSKSSPPLKIKNFIKKLNFKRRRKHPVHLDRKFCCHNFDRENFLCISQLEPPYKLFIEQVFENLLVLQESNKKSSQIGIDEREEKSFSFQSSSSQSSRLFKENLSEFSSKLGLDSLKSLNQIDRFSSVLFADLTKTSLTVSDFNLNYLSKIEIFDQETTPSKQHTMTNSKGEESREQQAEFYKRMIDPVQVEMMPSWSSMEEIEKVGIVDLLAKWHISIHKRFQNLAQHDKQKSMMTLALNETRMIKKGSFRFDLNRNYLEKNQIELLNLSKFESDDSKETTTSVRPNTRLILKCFKQFIESFECLSKARQAKCDDLKHYWTNLNKFILHMSKGILRCCFYVHESVDLKPNAITLPPIYVLESDECELVVNGETNSPNVKLEFLYEYVYLCRSNLKQKLKKITTDEAKTRQEILKYHKLVLNCLIRLIQVSTLIRDNLVMKRINYDEVNVCDIDIYSHYMSNECRLVREYLKKILEIS